MVSKLFVETDHGLVAQVTFALPNSLWADAIYLVGDFNNWNRQSHPLQRDNRGEWRLTIELEPGRVYQYRYLCQDGTWLSDCQTEASMPNPLGGYNSAVVTEPNEPHD